MQFEKELEKICNHFGVDFQLREKLPEELLELVDECQAPTSDERIIDEIADVLLLIRQITKVKDWESKITERIEFKIKRTLERIESGYYDSIT